MFKIISQLRGGQFFAYRFSNLHQICTTFKLGLVGGLKNVGYAKGAFPIGFKTFPTVYDMPI